MKVPLDKQARLLSAFSEVAKDQLRIMTINPELMEMVRMAGVDQHPTPCEWYWVPVRYDETVRALVIAVAEGYTEERNVERFAVPIPGEPHRRLILTVEAQYDISLPAPHELPEWRPSTFTRAQLSSVLDVSSFKQLRTYETP